MCTAIKYKGAFGRTLDFEKDFGVKVIKCGKGKFFKFVYEGEKKAEYDIIGAAYMLGDTPLFFDGMNGRGLCAAALNFPRLAVYRGERRGKLNLASFEVIGYILSLFKSVEEVKYGLRNLNITSDVAEEGLEATALHWMVADKSESIVIEPLSSGVKIYENNAEILTNSPDFSYHMTRLSDYMQLRAAPPENALCKAVRLEAYSRGMGALGLPGDWSSSSRFVRAFFVKENLDAQNMNDAEAVFEIAKSVFVPRGCVVSESGESVGTVYISLMDMNEGRYCYRKQGCDEAEIRF